MPFTETLFCPAYKLLPMLGIETIAFPIYTSYQRFSRGLELLSRSLSFLLSDLAAAFEVSEPFRQGNSLGIYAPRYLVECPCEFPSWTFSSRTGMVWPITSYSEDLWARHFSSGIDLKVLCEPDKESEPEPWLVIVLEATGICLMQSAREIWNFVSHGRGAPWTLLFRDLFTRGQSYHS